MKKVIVLLLGFALFLSMFCGCSSKSDTINEEIKLADGEYLLRCIIADETHKCGSIVSLQDASGHRISSNEKFFDIIPLNDDEQTNKTNKIRCLLLSDKAVKQKIQSFGKAPENFYLEAPFDATIYTNVLWSQTEQNTNVLIVDYGCDNGIRFVGISKNLSQLHHLIEQLNISCTQCR